MSVSARPRASTQTTPSFSEIYDTQFNFVWRSLRQLGVAEAIDDAVQDVFLVVHRRLAEFEGRSSMRTWIFGIALRVAHDHRRRKKRKGGLEALEVDVVDRAPLPDERAEAFEALGLVQSLLDGLSESQRTVFVLAELEELSAPEIAELLGVPLNTVYSRLRTARQAFEERRREREGGDRASAR